VTRPPLALSPTGRALLVWLRAPGHLLAASLCAGLALANAVRVHEAGLDGSVLAAAVLVAAETPAARAACLAALALCVGWWWASARLDALDRSALAPLVGRAGHAVVVVASDPRPGRFAARAEGRIRSFDGAPVDEPVELELPLGAEPPQGAVLDGLARLKAPRPPAHGFDERATLRRRGIHVVVRLAAWRVVGRRGGLAGIGDRLHAWLRRDAALGLAGEPKAIVDGVVLGETQGIEDGLLARFRASGLYHVLAVDGLKVSAVGAGAAGLAFLLGAGRRLAELAALAAVGAYVLAVGAHPSVIRAAVAAGLVSFAWLAARQRDGWQALVVAAVALLAWNPSFVGDPGFQLSFAAVAAIFVVSPRVVRALEGYPVPRGLRELIGVSTACGLATAPVTWSQFRQISLVTVPANVVGVPIVAEMLGVALVTALVAPVAPPLAAVLARADGLGAAALAAWARLTGGLPAAQVTSPRGAAAVAGAALAAAYAWRRWRTERQGRRG
jgi:competence protein ComEC